jgi:hypothetical protein
MGMSMAVVGAIASLGIAWVSTKAAVFGKMIAEHDFVRLRQLFTLTVRQSYLVLVLASIAGFALILFVEQFSFAKQRFVPVLPLAFLLLAGLANHSIYCEAILLRAFKEEPFMLLSIVNGLLVGSGVWYFGKEYGAIGMAVVYLGIQALVILPWGTWIWWRKWRRMRPLPAAM